MSEIPYRRLLEFAKTRKSGRSLPLFNLRVAKSR
jgi:hypothetical protein